MPASETKPLSGFVVQFTAGDANPAGNLQYNDHAANVTIKALYSRC